MIKFLKKMLYALPFGLKSGDNIMFQQMASPSSNEINVKHVITNDNLGESLLKGEITQQVEEVRYMDYKVSNESKKYKYLGDGNAKKIDIIERDLNNYSFSQENKIICESVYDELKRVGSYGVDKYTISIITTDIPRFKLENYCKMVDVKFNKDVRLTLHFSKYPDKYDITSKAFINNLKNIISSDNIHKHEIYHLQQLSFVTYKAINEDDLISYVFHTLKLRNVIENSHEYLLVYSADYYERNNLLDKFYSKTMQEKYDSNKQKSSNATFMICDRIEKCDVCGCDMNKYDADITKSTYGKSICLKCLEKEIIANNGF